MILILLSLKPLEGPSLALFKSMGILSLTEVGVGAEADPKFGASPLKSLELRQCKTGLRSELSPLTVFMLLLHKGQYGSERLMRSSIVLLFPGLH